jgi:ribosome-associated protein
MTATEKAKLIVEYAEELKAEHIETLDVRQKTSVADYFIVCTGTSDRHVSSIAERIAENLRKKHKTRPLREEGGNTGWVLQDYGDVVLHVMREEQRQFYDLESLWKSMQPDPNLE